MNIISLLEGLVNSLVEAEEKFFMNPMDFRSLEMSAKASTEAFAAGFLGEVLSSANKHISESEWRKRRYNIARNDKRTVISSVGDVTFDCTYFKNMQTGSYSYLLEKLIGLSKNERFTEEAEVALLTEALKTSYQEATRVLPSKQRITKTTVMNKVHGIAEEIPYEAPESLKEVDYLFIEADEDHIAEQHGDAKLPEGNTSFISKLVYVYEFKQDSEECSVRRKLVNSFYFGGLYPGKDGNERLWKNVQNYIDKTYNQNQLKRVFM